MTNQPAVEAGSSVLHFYLPVYISPWLQTILHPMSYYDMPKNTIMRQSLQSYTSRNVDSTPNIKEVIGVGKDMTNQARSSFLQRLLC